MFSSVVLGLLLGGLVGAQDVDGNGCLRLLGSVACPGFQYAYLSPSNLSNAFPFFSSVSSVSTFDVAALNYFTNPDQFETTKFLDQLGCSNASSAVIRYERTVLCSMWVNEKWSEQCLANYNGTTAATSQKMVCQDTCLTYSASEKAITNSSTYCPGPDLTNGNRSYQLNKDFVDCTDWTTLATNETGSCVAGDDNESNCGYGSSVAQLCDLCRASEPEDCCYTASTDISVCGYSLPVRANITSSTSSSSSPSSTGSLQSGAATAAALNSNALSKGQIAGIAVGSVIGGLLLLALLAFLALFCIRRRRSNKRNSTQSYPAGSMAQTSQSGHGHGFGSFFSTGGAAPNSSEKGLLGHQSAAAKSSPTMGGDTLYSGKAGNLGESSAAGAGAGAGLLAVGGSGGGGGMPGERTSGVVLPRVRDENQSGDRWIETGAEVTVLWPYQASLPDELDLRPGMKLRVLRLYDDAWGTAEIVSGGEGGEVGKQGAFPIVCVSEGSSLGSSAASSSGGH